MKNVLSLLIVGVLVISGFGAVAVSDVDDNFLVDKKRAEKIMDGIIKEKIDIEMWAEARVNSADEKLFKKMKKAGFKAIAFGIDGGSQDVLDFYNSKGISKKIGSRAIILAYQYNILEIYHPEVL